MPTQVASDAFVIRPPADLLRAHPELKRLAADLALSYVHRELLDDERLRRIGESLWRAAGDPDTLDRQLNDALNAAGLAVLPIVIENAAPGLLQLPWEILHHPRHGFLAREPRFALSRRTAAPPPSSAPAEPGPLRVLLFTSLPDDLDAERGRLDTESEQAAVQEALAPWVAEGWIDLKMPNDGRFETFASELKTFGPQLGFLSGHGRFHTEALDGAPGQGVFVFEGPDGESDPRDETAIAQAFVGTRVQCLVLSACESGKSASDALNSGLARRLALAGVPHVIGMRESILDPAAIAFARAFCDAVGQRERIDCAMQAARGAIARPLAGQTWREPQSGTAGVHAELSLGQWCLPMQLCADPGRPLIDWSFRPEPPAARPPSRSLATVTLPARFVGRRRELRGLQGALGTRRRRQLLITGPGGQGKTALAGTLAADLGRAGATVFAWSARPGNRWADFRLELEFGLTAERAQRYDRLVAQCPDEQARACILLRLLLEQHGGRVLHGNPRGLQFFAAAVRDLGSIEEDAFLERLAAAGAELQTDMALDLVVAHRTDAERALLRRLPAYRTPVPIEGIVKLGLDLPEPRWLLDGLLAVSLVEQRDAPDLLTREYQCPGTVADWLARQPGGGLEADWLGVAADFQLYCYRTARRNQEQAVAVHDALLAAGRRPEADRWVLNVIVGPMTRAGLYASLLKHWLPPVCESAEPKTRAAVLNLTGAQYWHLGDYRTALGYLEDGLAISQEIGDREGEGATLNNMGEVHRARGELDRAVDLYQRALAIWQETGNRAGEAASLNNIAVIHWVRGESDRALDLHQRALAISQETGYRAGEGGTLNNIAEIYGGRGQLDPALDHYRRSLAIWQETGDRAGEGLVLNNTGEIHQARDDSGRALDLYQRALAIRQEIGDRAGEGATLNNIGEIHRVRFNQLSSCSGDTATRCHPCIRRSAPGVPAPVPEPLAAVRCPNPRGAKRPTHA
ncbi:tetratricopeptide repeat protein [uncultured Thiodictyon sp.]|uniref:tetratricopeptide repeat protein n=1 Tax=uncultured Thiodictyon sp. TaxID=1846217 RepID=UPI0025FED73B|nr:tetratricopeptide repeat protein [uncultured Thiodictyon sp.]